MPQQAILSRGRRILRPNHMLKNAWNSAVLTRFREIATGVLVAAFGSRRRHRHISRLVTPVARRGRHAVAYVENGQQVIDISSDGDEINGHVFNAAGICRCGVGKRFVEHFHTRPCELAVRTVSEDSMHPDDTALRTHLEMIRVQFPELPAIPTTSFEYRGWFPEALARIRLNSKRRTLEEQNRLLSELKQAYGHFLDISKSIFDMSTRRLEAERDRVKMQREIAELEQQIDDFTRKRAEARLPPEADAHKRAAKVLRAEKERVRAEHGLKKAEKDLAELDRPPQDSPPKRPNPLHEFLRSLEEKRTSRESREEFRGKVMTAARKWAELREEDPERAERDAKKFYEDWERRNP
jgi:hypothetical protein